MTHVTILGGGLAGGLCALFLKSRRPDVDVLLIEQDERLGGNHVWSFFDSDVSAADRAVIDPLIVRHWNANDVRFPAYERTLQTGYNSIDSNRFDTVLRASLGTAVRRDKVVAALPDAVTLASGELIATDAVLDTRGFTAPPEGVTCGWQKFVGQMLEIPGHGVSHPVIMDAAVDQSDGYRFVYLLPFDDTRLFIEDTYYHEDPRLDRDLLAGRIADYAARHGWADHRVIHEETGVLPVVTGGRFDRFWPVHDPVARAGVRGGFFHPLTSYSVPQAIDFASWLAEDAPLDGSGLAAAARARAKSHWKSAAFDRLLGRMLFDAAEPDQRYRLLQHFYRKPDALVERFYASRHHGFDKLRILSGRPPVSIVRAMKVIFSP